MSRRVVVHPDFHGRAPREWAAWSALAGPAVALSRTSSTRIVRESGLSLHLKRYSYPGVIALRAALRHTFRRPSRVAREYRMLEVFRVRAGAAPAPVAFGEHRVAGFLREAFVASETVPDAVPLSEMDLVPRVFPRELGRVLARVHRTGLLHGALFARNVLAAPNGGILLVDLAHARAGPPKRLPPLSARARDFAFLEESLPGAGREERIRLREAYFDGTGETGRERIWTELLDRFRIEARERLRRRRRDRAQ